MIWFIAFAAVVAVWFLVSRAIVKEIEELHETRRKDRRLADERWQLAQERYDTVIELIAQIGVTLDNAFAAAKPEVKGAPRQRRKVK